MLLIHDLDENFKQLNKLDNFHVRIDDHRCIHLSMPIAYSPIDKIMHHNHCCCCSWYCCHSENFTLCQYMFVQKHIAAWVHQHACIQTMYNWLGISSESIAFTFNIGDDLLIKLEIEWCSMCEYMVFGEKERDGSAHMVSRSRRNASAMHKNAYRFLFAPKANHIHAYCASPTPLRSFGTTTHLHTSNGCGEWVRSAYNAHQKRTVA